MVLHPYHVDKKTQEHGGKPQHLFTGKQSKYFEISSFGRDLLLILVFWVITRHVVFIGRYFEAPVGSIFWVFRNVCL